MTDRLYLQDAFLDRFEAKVLEHRDQGDFKAVRLDRSAFYPEAGGQMADHGTLANCHVVDVQLDEERQVWHLLRGDTAPAVDQLVRGTIDFERRRSHMALHTGQHILSRALLTVAGASTLSSRLGERGCNIDVDLPKLSDSDLARVEDLANAVVNDDIKVRCYFPEASELEQLQLRRPSKVDEDIRVVAVGDYDITPCGGTHCSSSGQIGLIQIQSVQRHKKGLRLMFRAGKRARDAALVENKQLRTLASRFSCGNDGIQAAIDKLEQQLSHQRRTSSQLSEQLADYHAKELRELNQRDKVRLFQGLGIESLRSVARAVVQDANSLAIVGSQLDDGLHLIVARSSDLTIHCGHLLKELAEPLGGRGGGRPDHAQGRLPADADWHALEKAFNKTGAGSDLK